MLNNILRLSEVRKVELFKSEIDQNISAGYSLVNIKCAGICGSDLHYFRHAGLGSYKKTLPMDIGHEVSGEVILSHNKDLIGSNVAIEPSISCGHCDMCLSGMGNLCRNIKFMGTDYSGGIATYALLRDTQLFVNDYLSLEELMMTEPLGVAIHAYNRTCHSMGENVAILGAGTIGLLIGKISSILSNNIYIWDPLQYRRSFALDYIPYSKSVLDDHSEKFDIVYDAAGTQDAIDSAINLVRPGGKIVLVGIPEHDTLQYNPHRLRINEVTIYNSRRSHNTTMKSIELIDTGIVNVKELITHRFRMDEAQTAFEIASDYKDNSIKVVILP